MFYSAFVSKYGKKTYHVLSCSVPSYPKLENSQGTDIFGGHPASNRTGDEHYLKSGEGGRLWNCIHQSFEGLESSKG